MTIRSKKGIRKTPSPAELAAGVTQQTRQCWPTPRAADYKGATSPQAAQQARERIGSCNLPEAAAESAGGGQLNPTWVEWLMGFPEGWTDCEDSETQ